MGAILKELHNSASKFQFPSMPKDDVDVKRETAYQEYNILGKGKMSYPSGMGTQIIKWSGYFWGAGRKKLASVNQKWIAPKTCASKLKSWQTKKTPLNLVVSEAGINEDVTIKSFEYKPFGGHGDYSYEISFVPYVEMKIYTTKELGTKKKAKRKRKPLDQVPRNLLKRKRPTGLSEAIRFAEYLVRNIKLNQSGEISTMPIRRLLKRLLRNMAGAIATTDIGYIQEQY